MGSGVSPLLWPLTGRIWGELFLSICAPLTESGCWHPEDKFPLPHHSCRCRRACGQSGVFRASGPARSRAVFGTLIIFPALRLPDCRPAFSSQACNVRPAHRTEKGRRNRRLCFHRASCALRLVPLLQVGPSVRICLLPAGDCSSGLCDTARACAHVKRLGDEEAGHGKLEAPPQVRLHRIRAFHVALRASGKRPVLQSPDSRHGCVLQPRGNRASSPWAGDHRPSGCRLLRLREKEGGWLQSGGKRVTGTPVSIQSSEVSWKRGKQAFIANPESFSTSTDYCLAGFAR